jgi:hypothetical protein
MYYSGQVVWSIDNKKAVQIGDDVWNEKSYPIGKTIHFINGAGKIICPATIKEANLLLERRRIVPAPLSDDQCWSCDLSLHQKPKDICEATSEHEKCFECGKQGIYGHRFGHAHCPECYRKIEEGGFLAVAEELVAAIKASTKTSTTSSIPLYHNQAVCKAFDKLKELMDPSGVKKHSVALKVAEEMVQLYMREQRK